MFQMSFDVTKCKEYHIDCINYHTWIVEKVCNFGGLQVFTNFLAEHERSTELHTVDCHFT